MKKKKPTKRDRVYLFRVSLGLDSPYCEIRGFKEESWRDIAVLGEQTLYNFAEAIVDSFDFDFDHCFGFYSNWQKNSRYPDSKEKYELFTDLPDVEHTAGAEGVQKVKLSQVFQNTGKKMLFYFDYGDSWHFLVELKSIEEPDPKKSYPLLIEGCGKAPEQYGPIEEDDED